MTGMRVLAGTMLLLTLSVCGWTADIRTIRYSQMLERPPGQTFTQFARGVAIDGADLIVLATHDGGQSALLYHRASGTGRFAYVRTLLTFAEPRDLLQVRMKNGIAVIKFGDREWIFERSGGNYVAGVAASALTHAGGVAISGNSILFGGDNCGYDGVVYQKATDGRWTITGRLDDNQGACVPEGLAVELNYDTALIHSPGTPEVTTWRRNGTALDWVSAGALEVNAEVAASTGPFALQNSTVVTPQSYVFRREGNAWAAHGRVVPADYGMGSGNAYEVKYRDGVLVTSEDWLPEHYNAGLYVYLETTPGDFEHVAILPAYEGTDINDHDISGRTVVAGVSSPYGSYGLIYTLREPLAAPEMIDTDFEDSDTGDFSAVSGQFAIAARGSNHVLAQTSTTNFSVALAEDSDSAYYQRIEAKIFPTYGSTDGWVGLVARYADANNYYYVAVRKNGTTGLYRRRNGVNELLRDLPGGPPGQIVQLVASSDEVYVSVNNQFAARVLDSSLPRGRAGLITYHAAADFDDVRITATPEAWLLNKRFVDDADVHVKRSGREFNLIGGDWQYRETFPPYLDGYLQRDPSRSAFAFIGAQVRNQEIETAFSVDAVSSATGAWVGLLGRYVDSRTHYYATVGTNGRVEIRKRVNGVVTLLGAAKQAMKVGDVFIMRFRLVGDQLQLFLGDRQVLSVRDDDIPAGAHGLATNRAAATWHYLYVTQP